MSTKTASPVGSTAPFRTYSHWSTNSIDTAPRRNIFYKGTPTCETHLPTSNILEYVIGRWLRNDEENRLRRSLHRDFNQLCQRVIPVCPGATSIVKGEKAEDGCNHIFIFTCDNGKRLVAKLPTTVAGPQRLTTHSEVATIKYLQSKTTVPIPNILDWSDESSHTIGSEYIIMEHARGTRLGERWLSMSIGEKIRCISAIVNNMQQMVALDFPAYGSIYFTDGTVNPAVTKLINSDFCLGPNCGNEYWDCNFEDPKNYTMIKPNRGPWSDMSEYCKGLIDTGFSRLPSRNDTIIKNSSHQGSVATHTKLLTYGRQVLHRIIGDARIHAVAAATLLHRNFHKRNIFVSKEDPTVVTDIIDWQSSCVKPTLEYGDTIPDFLGYNPNASDEERLADKEAEICQKAYDVSVKFRTPELAVARVLDQDLLRQFRYCHRTWHDGAAAYRQDLIDLAGCWKKLDLPGFVSLSAANQRRNEQA